MVNVVISADPRYNVNKSAIRNAVLEVLSSARVNGNIELEVNIVGNRKIHELNKKYRGIDNPTDILTFVFEDPSPQTYQKAGFKASPDKILRLGSILISYNIALEDASLDGKSVDDEISFLVEHGTKHLLGIHHN